MQAVEIKKDIYLLTANDRRTHLFENLWPIEQGVAYNSYVVVDEKIALIDTIERCFTDDYLELLDLTLKGKNVDYLIINHMEPDHSASIKAIVDKYPDIVIIGNKMTFALLKGFYGLAKNTMEKKDGESLDLGSKRITFFGTPWLHWPETMMSYIESEKILFSGDAFGSFGTLDGSYFADETDIQVLDNEMLRYYSNIVGKYSKYVLKALEKLSSIEPNIIAATHGPVWRKNIAGLLQKYQKWASHDAEKGVVIVFGSMYGNTEKMADTVARELVENGIKKVIIHDASKTHLSYILRDIWRYKGLIAGSSAYNAGIFPPIEELTYKLEGIELTNRIFASFGSSGWNKAGVRGLNKFAEKTTWEFISPSAEASGKPDDTAMENCKTIGREMARRLNEIYSA
jgi:flavorubredoxin